MADDRRIGSLLGGIARAVGPSEQDIRSLERRREEHERRTAKKPVRAFDEMLANDQQARDRDEERRRHARGEPQPESEEEPGEHPPKPAKGPTLPRGRGRLIRG